MEADLNPDPNEPSAVTPAGKRSDRRRRLERVRRKRRILPAVRIRFAWWKFWLVAFAIVFSSALLLLLRPWTANPPPPMETRIM